MEFENLSKDLQDKVRACTSPEDLRKLAEAEGTELTDDQLDALAGGVNWSCPTDCPSHNCPRNK